MLETRPTHHAWPAKVGAAPCPSGPLPRVRELTLTLMTTSLLLQVLSILPNTYEPQHQTTLMFSRIVKCSLDPMRFTQRKLIHTTVTCDEILEFQLAAVKRRLSRVIC